MYPLLISAVSSIASSLIEKLAASAQTKVAAPAENFAAVLEKSAAVRAGSPGSGDTQIAALRQRLLDSPEVRTLLASADPAKQPALSLSADGTLTARSADGRTTNILLSPESAATARELVALSNVNAVPHGGIAGQILPPPATTIALR